MVSIRALIGEQNHQHHHTQNLHRSSETKNLYTRLDTKVVAHTNSLVLPVLSEKFVNISTHGCVRCVRYLLYTPNLHHGVSASQSSHYKKLSSYLIFTFCDLHFFKLSILTSSVFIAVNFPTLQYFALKNPNLQSPKETDTPDRQMCNDALHTNH